MSWTPPRYLQTSVVRSNQIRYVWNEADLRWVYTLPEGVDPNGATWASWIDAAVCGLTIAIVEWPIFRLMPFDSDPTPQQAVEAAWCANIDRHYCEGLEFNRDEWRGPVRGPLLSCMNMMHEALFESMEAGTRPLHCPSIASGLIEHTCGESYPAFLAWREQIIERLSHSYQAPDPLQDLYGEAESTMVVPPQAFDPQVNFDMALAPRLADEFLRNVDYDANPLLLTPDEMRRDGFEGVPYRYPYST